MGLGVCFEVGYSWAVRVHVHLDDELVRRLDARVGRRGRSRFVERATLLVLEDEERWLSIEEGIGSIDDQTHAWDADPAGWVESERRSDASRLG